MSAAPFAASALAWAQSSVQPALPLKNLGLEHLDIVVPDTAVSAKFYMQVFRTKLHQQPTPLGLDHVMLNVRDIDGSLPYYRFVYGKEVEGARQSNPERLWLNLKADTRIGLQPEVIPFARLFL